VAELDQRHIAGSISLRGKGSNQTKGRWAREILKIEFRIGFRKRVLFKRFLIVYLPEKEEKRSDKNTNTGFQHTPFLPFPPTPRYHEGSSP